MSDFANPTGTGYVALMQRDQNLLPRCIIIRIAQSVADPERCCPRADLALLGDLWHTC